MKSTNEDKNPVEEVSEMKRDGIMPIHKLKKDDWVWLFTHHCKHGHRYTEHYACYQADYPTMVHPSALVEKVGFLDIETSNLDANFGIILTYCIKVGGKKTILTGTVKKTDIAKYPADKTDTGVVKQLVNDMLKFDRIVTHYGSRFDIPFIRTRALYDGLDFPQFGSIRQDDTWVMAKHKLKLNSNRLDTIARTILGKTDKTHIEFSNWIAGTRGDEKAISYILQHNKFDVTDLEKIWLKLRGFSRFTCTSI
jgi:uncharacterized protein YprB with RNaseH-like and TPR domain